MHLTLQLIILLSYLFQTQLRITTKDENFKSRFNVGYIKEGDGKTFPNNGDLATIHYHGTYTQSGKPFDSSIERGDTFGFIVGQNQVILCWEQVIKMMSKNERIKIDCPYDLAYGEKGVIDVIPEKADLTFDIELLEVSKAKDDL